MKISKLKFHGESLVEVLIAISILGLVLISSFILLNRGISTNITIKNKIIAINIAREGVEGIRNIRDINWLKYSGDRRNKWICLDSFNTTHDPNTIIDCSENITDSKYTLDFNDDLSRFFAKKETTQSDELNLSSGVNGFSNYRLYKNNTNSRYTHNTSGNTSTIFYRQIQLTPEKPDECDDYPNTDDYDCTQNSRLHIISRVQWIEPRLTGDENAVPDDLIGTIVMETYLYDYFGRDEY